MNLFKVYLVLVVLVGGAFGGWVMGDLIGLTGSLQRVGFAAGYTFWNALALAFWVVVGTAFIRWIKR